MESFRGFLNKIIRYGRCTFFSRLWRKYAQFSAAPPFRIPTYLICNSLYRPPPKEITASGTIFYDVQNPADFCTRLFACHPKPQIFRKYSISLSEKKTTASSLLLRVFLPICFFIQEPLIFSHVSIIPVPFTKSTFLCISFQNFLIFSHLRSILLLFSCLKLPIIIKHRIKK